MRATFQNFLLPRLGIEHVDKRTLHEWIGSNRFSRAELVENKWRLEAYSSEELYGAFTPDFQRFAFSSFETFSEARLERDQCGSTSWPLLKLYYSAFFAAHAITRATGNGHVNLDRNAAKAVNDYLSLIGILDVFKSGPYKVSIEERGGSVTLILDPSSEGNGVHDSFWQYFCSFLADLGTEAVHQALPSATSFVRETGAIQSCIKDNSRSGVWFSATRNAINYRHEFDCWLPISKNSRPMKLEFPTQLGDPDAMENSLAEREDELTRLINLSTYLASLNHHIVLNVESGISGNSAFVRSWKRLKSAVS